MLAKAEDHTSHITTAPPRPETPPRIPSSHSFALTQSNRGLAVKINRDTIIRVVKQPRRGTPPRIPSPKPHKNAARLRFYALCYLLFPVSVALTSYFRVDSISTPYDTYRQMQGLRSCLVQGLGNTGVPRPSRNAHPPETPLGH